MQLYIHVLDQNGICPTVYLHQIWRGVRYINFKKKCITDLHTQISVVTTNLTNLKLLLV